MSLNKIEKKKEKLVISIILVLFLLAIPSGMSQALSQDTTDTSDDVVVMATWIGDGDTPSWSGLGYEVIADYGSSVMAKVERTELEGGHPDIILKEFEQKKTIESDALSFDPKSDNGFKTNSDGLHLLQMVGPVYDQWIKELENAGVEFIHYVPNNAFLVDLDDTSIDVESKSYVRAVSSYGPNLRVHPDVYKSEDEVSKISVMVKPDIDTRQMLDSLTDDRVELFSHKGNKVYKVDTKTEYITRLKEIPGLIWIEPFYQPELYDEVSSEIVGGAFAGKGTAVQNQGYTGKDVTVSITDTGVDTGVKSDMHPDLKDQFKTSYWYGSESEPIDGIGHGTHCAGIVAGKAATGLKDQNGMYYGTGVAPEAGIVNQKVFTTSGWFTNPDLDILTSEAVESGSEVSSNSWGASTYGGYDLTAAAYDAYTRDSDVFTNGSQEVLYVFAAGNDGRKGLYTVGSPGTAKNVLTVGATENDRPEQGSFSDNPDSIADFSSRGPTVDDRLKPEIVAPGTWIASALSSESTPGWAYGSPDGKYYEYCSGTSMATPQVAGGAASFIEFYRKGYQADPSPALIKSALINGAVDITGENQGGAQPVPNIHEGWGRMDLTNTLLTEDSVEFFDQDLSLKTGDSYGKKVEVTDTSKPLRVTMSYTDVPAAPDAAKTLVNDLNLIVQGPDGNRYLGNAFSNGWSDSSINQADDLNNVENVYIKNPVKGEYNIIVYGASVPVDALDDTTAIDQDFALVVKGGFKGSAVGSIGFDKDTYSPTDTLEVEVLDSNLNKDKSIAETVTIKLSSDYPDGENIVLTEDGKDSISFTGTVELTEENSDYNDGKLQVVHGSEITGVYLDNTPYGERRTYAVVDGQSPIIEDVKVDYISSNTATLNWTTDEETTGTLYWRKTSDDWTVVEVEELTDVHKITLENLIPSTEYEFYLEVEDDVGYITIGDNAGLYYSFITDKQPDILLVDDDGESWSGPNTHEQYFIDVLENLGYSYDVWNYLEYGTPSVNVLRNYEAVIWTTGEDYQEPLSLDDEQVLADYLDNNGKLYLSSELYLMRTGVNSFVENYLEISSTMSSFSGAVNVTGVENDTISDGMGPYNLTYPFHWERAYKTYPSENGTEIFIDETGEPVSVRSNNSDLPYRTVFTSFPFEAIADNNMANGEAMMDGILDYLLVEEDVDVSVKNIEFSQPWSNSGEKVNITARISNDGITDLTDLEVAVKVEGSLVNTDTVQSLPAGEFREVSIEFTPDTLGELNVSFEVTPISGENETEDNSMTRVFYCRDPIETIKMAVVDSYGTDAPYFGVEMVWDELEATWWKYGNYKVEIDWETLDKEGITYSDLRATDADVLYLSNAWTSEFYWEYTDYEIEAIKNYVVAGHGIIASGGTLSGELSENNMKLADVFGLNTSIPGEWGHELQDPMVISDTNHPIFEGIPNDYTLGNPGVCVNHDVTRGNVKATGTISSLIGGDNYAYLTESRYGGGNSLYFPHIPEEAMANKLDKILIYNSILWSYQNSTEKEHELYTKTFDEPKWGEPGEEMYIDTGVFNVGTMDENNIEVNLYVDEEIKDSVTIYEIPSGKGVLVNLSWIPERSGEYDIKVRAEPVDGETFDLNNDVNYVFRALYKKGHLKIAALDGFGTYFITSFIIYDYMEQYWYKFGNYSLEFDYTSLSSNELALGEDANLEMSYDDLMKTQADILFNAADYTDMTGFDYWKMTDTEVSAVENFTKDGCGIVWGGGFWTTHSMTEEKMFYNNRKLMPMFGLDPNTPTYPNDMHVRNDDDIVQELEYFNLRELDHPVLKNINDPYQPAPEKLNLDGVIWEGYDANVFSGVNVTTANVLANTTIEGVHGDMFNSTNTLRITEKKAGMGQTVYTSFNPIMNGDTGFIPEAQDIQLLYNMFSFAYENTTYGPRISHESKESIALDKTLDVNANVRDPDGEITDVTLYYKGTAGSSFSSKSMNDLGNGGWHAEIPGQSEGGVIQYYLEAEDNDGHVVTNPKNSPVTTYNVTVDAVKPTIIHEPVTEMDIGQPGIIQAEVLDQFGVSEVVLKYTNIDGNTNEKTMASIGNNKYTAFIPSEENIGQVSYQVLAEDENGNVNTTQEYTIDITGQMLEITVVDQDGDPLGYVSGTFVNENTSESEQFVTGPDGSHEYSLSLLTDGYSLGDTITADVSYLEIHGTGSVQLSETSGVIELEVRLDAEIVDSNHPQIVDHSSDTAETGRMFDFSVDVSDNIEVAEVHIQYWTDVSEKVNKTLFMDGEYYERAVSIPDEATKLKYKIAATDSSENCNVTGVITRDVDDVIVPTAVANEDMTVDMGTEVVLDASDSTDNVGIRNWTWTVNSNSMTSETVNYTFENAGKYTVELVVEDEAGNTAFTTFEVTVLDTEAPNADAGDIIQIKIGEQVVFDASASVDNVGISSYTWYVEDIVLTGETAQHNFAETGSFNVTLEVTDMAGNVDTDNVTVLVSDGDKPTADAGEDLTIDMGTTIPLDGSGSYDNYAIEEYIWNIGGEEYTVETFEYTFDDAGTFEAVLTVVDAGGNEDTDRVIITVLDTEEPVADAGEDTSISVGEEVTFDGSGSSDNVQIVSYEWTIDGITLSGEQTNYVFDQPETYEVTLTVRDSSGNVGTDSFTLTVVDDEGPEADAGQDKTVEVGTEVTLTGADSTDNVAVTNYIWQIDGNELTGKTLDYTFDKIGSYDVNLTVSDGAGNTDTHTVRVTVEDTEKPRAESIDIKKTNVGEKVVFDASKSVDNTDIIEYMWIIDGEEYSGKQIEHEFDKNGEHEVTLRVSDEAGNIDERTFTVDVQDESSLKDYWWILPLLILIGGALVMLSKRDLFALGTQVEDEETEEEETEKDEKKVKEDTEEELFEDIEE
ncbi:MAG: PKD domain-containing protein [Thermoplasmatota archaeon]